MTSPEIPARVLQFLAERIDSVPQLEAVLLLWEDPQRLWSEEVVEHHGEFFDFGPVMFEPKPVQKPWPPIVVGGESAPALRRAARFGDGWVGLDHTPETVAGPVARLRELRDGKSIEVTVGGLVEGRDDVERWEQAGVDRLLVSPWRRSPDALDGLRRFADTVVS